MVIIQNILARRELIANLVSRELKSKYKGTALGLLWSILTPLFMAVIYVFFLRLLARGVPLSQIIIGVFAWTFTVNCVQGGMNAITGNANLVKKVFFPRHLLPLSVTLANLVNFLLSLVVQTVLLVVLIWVAGDGWDAYVWVMPCWILYHTLFNLSLAYLLSASNVYFRDTQHLVGVFLSAWFFISPVMYDIGMIQHFADTRPWLMNVYMINPMAVIVTGYRAMLLDSAVWFWNPGVWLGLLWPIGLFIAAGMTFRRSQKYFSDML